MNTVKWLKIAALILLGWAAGISLLFGIGEMAGGDPSGAGHLIPGVLIGLTMWLGWKRPLWAGIASLAMGSVALFLFAGALRNPQAWLAPFLIYIAPLLLAGLLFLLAARLARSDRSMEAQR